MWPARCRDLWWRFRLYFEKYVIHKFTTTLELSSAKKCSRNLQERRGSIYQFNYGKNKQRRPSVLRSSVAAEKGNESVPVKISIDEFAVVLYRTPFEVMLPNC